MAGSLKVGTLSVDLTANTATFELNLDKAAASGKKSLEQINKVDLGEARGALMVLGEEIGVRLPRHVTSFIATLPGVSTALAAAFPIVAIVAVGKAIMDATEKAQKHAEELQKQQSEAIASGNAITKMGESLRISTLRLQDQINVLNKLPKTNTLAILFAEAAQKADQLTEAIQRAIAADNTLMSNQAQGALARIFLGTGDVQKMVNALSDGVANYKQQLVEIGNQISLAEAGRNEKEISADRAKYQQKLAEYNAFLSAQQAALTAFRNKRAGALQQPMADESSGGSIPGMPANEALAQADTEVRDLQNDLTVLRATAMSATSTFKDLGANTSAAVHAAQLEAEQALFAANLKAKNILPTAQDIAKAAADEAREDREILDARTKMDALFGKQASNQEKQTAAEVLRGQRLAALATQVANANVPLEEKLRNERSLLDQINGDLAIQKAKMDALANSTFFGLIGSDQDKQAYAQAVRDFEEMKRQQLQIEKQYDQLMNQTWQMKLGQMVAQWQDANQQFGQFYIQEINTMNSSLSNFIVTGKVNWYSLAQSAVESIIKIGLQWVESHTFMAGLANAWRAAQNALQLAANGTMATSYAYLAAAETLADVPFPDNLDAAPEVLAIGQTFAAAAFTGESGGFLPNAEALVHTHPKELILPAPIATHIMNSFTTNNSTTSNGGGHTFVFSPQVSAIDGASVQGMLDQHGPTFMKYVAGQLRRRNY